MKKMLFVSAVILLCFSVYGENIHIPGIGYCSYSCHAYYRDGIIELRNYGESYSLCPRIYYISIKPCTSYGFEYSATYRVETDELSREFKNLSSDCVNVLDSLSKVVCRAECESECVDFVQRYSDSILKGEIDHCSIIRDESGKISRFDFTKNGQLLFGFDINGEKTILRFEDGRYLVRKSDEEWAFCNQENEVSSTIHKIVYAYIDVEDGGPTQDKLWYCKHKDSIDLFEFRPDVFFSTVMLKIRSELNTQGEHVSDILFDKNGNPEYKVSYFWYLNDKLSKYTVYSYQKKHNIFLVNFYTDGKLKSAYNYCCGNGGKWITRMSKIADPSNDYYSIRQYDFDGNYERDTNWTIGRYDFRRNEICRYYEFD